MPDKDNFNCVIDEVNEYAKTRNKVLCILQETYGKEEVLKWGIAILDRLQQTEILQQRMYDRSVQVEAKDWEELDDRTLPRTELVALWIVRDMWERQECGCASQGWESTKQRDCKSPTIVPELSYEDTPSAQDLFDMWSKGKGIWLLQQTLFEIQKIWESNDCKRKGGDEMNGVKTVVRRLTPL